LGSSFALLQQGGHKGLLNRRSSSNSMFFTFKAKNSDYFYLINIEVFLVILGKLKWYFLKSFIGILTMAIRIVNNVINRTWNSL